MTVTTSRLDDGVENASKRVLARANGNVAAAARLFGITRPADGLSPKSRGIVDEGDATSKWFVSAARLSKIIFNQTC